MGHTDVLTLHCHLCTNLHYDPPPQYIFEHICVYIAQEGQWMEMKEVQEAESEWDNGCVFLKVTWESNMLSGDREDSPAGSLSRGKSSS